MAATEDLTIVARNRKARHNYELRDPIEAGLVLLGSEVKSLREGTAQIGESHVVIRDGEAWVQNLHIAPYKYAQSHSGHDPIRLRKLLLKKREIERLELRLQTERLSIIPLRLYFRKNKAKLEIALGKGKSNVDKRHDMAKREANRDVQREIGRALKSR